MCVTVLNQCTQNTEGHKPHESALKLEEAGWDCKEADSGGFFTQPSFKTTSAIYTDFCQAALGKDLSICIYCTFLFIELSHTFNESCSTPPKAIYSVSVGIQKALEVTT